MFDRLVERQNLFNEEKKMFTRENGKTQKTNWGFFIFWLVIVFVQ